MVSAQKNVVIFIHDSTTFHKSAVKEAVPPPTPHPPFAMYNKHTVNKDQMEVGSLS